MDSIWIINIIRGGSSFGIVLSEVPVNILKILGFFPPIRIVFMEQGKLLFADKKYEESRLYFESHPSCESWNHLGKIYERGLGIDANLTIAYQYYEKAAAKGNAYSMYRLAMCHENGIGCLKDEKKALEYHEQASINGSVNSMNYLALLYREGRLVPKDVAKSLSLLLKASDKNSIHAFHHLGYVYENALGVKQNLETAYLYYSKAVNMGSAKSMHAIGRFYQSGLFVERDYVSAKKYHEMAIENGFELSWHNIGHLYLKGLGVKLDLDLARQCFERLVDYDNSLNDLGKMYIEGLSVEKSASKAKSLWEKSYRLTGNLKSLHNLAFLADMDHDYELARKYYEIGAEKNHCDSLNNLGLMYNYGKGVDVDLDKAIQLYERAFQEGNHGALQNMARVYILRREYSKASDCFAIVAKKGYSPVYFELATLAEIQKQFQDAKDYYLQCLDHGIYNAYTYLGILFLEGKCGTVDTELAKKYFEMGIEKDVPDCFNQMGFLYEKGIEVSLDYQKARSFYEKAIAKGSYKFAHRLGYLFENGLGMLQPDHNLASTYYNMSPIKTKEEFPYLLVIGLIFTFLICGIYVINELYFS